MAINCPDCLESDLDLGRYITRGGNVVTIQPLPTRELRQGAWVHRGHEVVYEGSRKRDQITACSIRHRLPDIAETSRPSRFAPQ